MSDTVPQASALLKRALKQLVAWQAKYGDFNPKWLPPAGDVRLAEDIGEYLASQAPAIVALQRLDEYCDESDNARYGTLSVSLVRGLVKEGLASQAPAPAAIAEQLQPSGASPARDSLDHPAVPPSEEKSAPQ